MLKAEYCEERERERERMNKMKINETPEEKRKSMYAVCVKSRENS